MLSMRGCGSPAHRKPQAQRYSPSGRHDSGMGAAQKRAESAPDASQERGFIAAIEQIAAV